jgi:rhodanese-related sulfurtransferase
MTLFNAFTYGQKPSCSDAKFDKTVKKYLNQTVPTIDVTTAYNQKDNFIFLDSRELKEYTVSHLPKARYVGYDKFDLKTIQDIPKDKDIIVYCSIGYRSEKIGEKLIKAGYKNVKNLYGSIFEWSNRSYPLVDNAGKTTNQIHTYNGLWSKYVTNPSMIKRH